MCMQLMFESNALVQLSYISNISTVRLQIIFKFRVHCSKLEKNYNSIVDKKDNWFIYFPIIMKLVYYFTCIVLSLMQDLFWTTIHKPGDFWPTPSFVNHYIWNPPHACVSPDGLCMCLENLEKLRLKCFMDFFARYAQTLKVELLIPPLLWLYYSILIYNPEKILNIICIFQKYSFGHILSTLGG